MSNQLLTRRPSRRAVSLRIVCPLMYFAIATGLSGLFALVYGYNWCEHESGAPGRRPLPIEFGYGRPNQASYLWAWRTWDIGVQSTCRTDVVEASQPRLSVTPTGPIGWQESSSPPWWSVAHEQPEPPADWKAGCSIVDYAFGWPMRCMTYRVLNVTRAATADDVLRHKQALAAAGIVEAPIGFVEGDLLTETTVLRGTSSGDGPVWATSILWRGLLVNGLVNGFLLALPHIVVVNFRFIVRQNRRRRGLCMKCGYNRRGIDASSSCPECGWNSSRN
jgi:hypothetical protein